MPKHAYVISFTTLAPGEHISKKSTHTVRAMNIKEAWVRFDRWFAKAFKDTGCEIGAEWVEKSDDPEWIQAKDPDFGKGLPLTRGN